MGSNSIVLIVASISADAHVPHASSTKQVLVPSTAYHARGRLRYTAWQDERSSRTFVDWARKRKAAVRGTGWNRSFVTADCESTFSSNWHYLHVAHIFTSFSMHPKIVSYSTSSNHFEDDSKVSL